MKGIIKKILREFDEFEWADEIIDHSLSPYEMNIPELSKFLNDFFESHPSPKLGRYYQCKSIKGWISISDNTGDYVNSSNSNNPFDGMVNKIIEVLKRYEGRNDTNRGIYFEYKDLYNTLRPLIKGNIREQANDMEWFDIDDIPEPTGLALANLIEQYFKDNELPYYVKVRNDNNVIYIADLTGNFIAQRTDKFTIDSINSEIEDALTGDSDSIYYKEYLQFNKDIQPLFDTLK